MSKKQLITETAIQLFAEKGIDATSIQQITDACGISKGAFYLSFASKKELVNSVVDHFIKTIASQVDQAVRAANTPKEKLYGYYYETFSSMNKYQDLTSVFFTQYSQTVNEVIIDQLEQLELLLNRLLYEILVELYPTNRDTLYDLVILIGSWIPSYAHLILTKTFGEQLDLQKLVESLMEKTFLLAEQSRIAFMSRETFFQHKIKMNPVSMEEIQQEAVELKQHVENHLLLDSIDVILQQFAQETPHDTIIIGMLANLRKEPTCNWFCFLVQNYMEQQNSS